MTRSNATPLQSITAETGEDLLAYVVELWTDDQSELEQILARASSAVLARATFTAAKDEHPGRRLVLRHGDTVIDRT